MNTVSQNMIEQLTAFMASKSLADNSKKAYGYDLQQFLELTKGQISSHRLKLYEQSLADLKLSAKKRKLSTVNQFLFFLYENEQLDRFYKLKSGDRLPAAKSEEVSLDLTPLYAETQQRTGQLIALMIAELGLLPSELLVLKASDVDLDFQVLTIKSSKAMRVLKLPTSLLPYLTEQLQADYLFDKEGQPYSRQWLFKQLSNYLASLGLGHLSAQKLREQYIVKQREAGTSIMDLAKLLGLKSPLTLEKYYKS